MVGSTDPLCQNISIRSIGAGGVGVGDLADGRVVFVPRTAPGDRVRISLTREKKRFAVGRMEELLEAGPHRHRPPCPLFDRCGGCALQHLNYSRQLYWKGRMVGDAMRRIGRLDVEDPEVRPSPERLRYRNKVSFTLRRLRGSRVVAGFHELEEASRILDIHDQCLLPEEGLMNLWTRLRDHWGPGAAFLPSGGELRLTLRGEEEGGALVVKGGQDDGKPQELLAAVSGLTSIWKDRGPGGLRHLAGDRSVQMAWIEESLEVAGDAFIQVNPGAGKGLHRLVLDQSRELAPATVIEAYCGVGIVGRALARDGRRVVGMELDPLSASEARRGAPPGFRVVEGRVEEHLETHLPVDLLIVNPPRGGLAREVPEQLRRTGPRGMIYVSCDPATLSRDLKGLGEGYQVQGVHAFDLFPQTAHVETVAVLARRRE